MKYISIIIPALLLLFAACTEKIDLELDDTYSRLVVEATITDRDDHHEIILTSTASYFHNESAPRIANAEVRISDGTNGWQLTAHQPGHYMFAEKIATQAGTEYQLEIDFEGKTYRASSYMKPVPVLDSLSVRPHPWIPNHHDLIAHFQEPAESQDFYMWKVYHNGVNLTSTAPSFRIGADDFINGQYIGLPFYIIQPEDELLVPGDTIRVEMYNIGYDYFMFLNAMQRNQGATGGPFAGPPANIPGNIDNGALGFFLAASVSEAEYIVGDEFGL